jgi:hypothetical protein
MAMSGKKAGLFGWAAGLLIVVAVPIAIYMSRSETASGSVCTSAGYAAVQPGMGKERVRGLLGKAGTERVKRSVGENLFSQGNDEAKINEGWIYQKGYEAAEVYFDAAGVVVGKGCGQG